MSETPAAAPKPSWDPTAKPDAAVPERGFFKELLVFAWQNKLWWIVPSLVILLGLGALVVIAGQDRFAPFFYSLF